VAELPTGTVTFLFTDIEGSTRLLKQFGAVYGELLAEHQRILRDAAATHGGREIDTQGDSFFFAFPRAKAALGAAVAAQRALADHDWPENGQIRVRMALHTGEPLVGEERYVGIGVHRAARIGVIGHGGQVLLSNATRELVEDGMGDVSVRELGSYRLKDIDRPERLFQLDIQGLQAEFPPLKAQKVEVQRPAWRRKTVFVPVLVLVLVAAVAVATVLARGGNSAPLVVPHSVVKIDAESNEIVDVIPVGRNPGEVRVVGDYVFVSSEADKTLARIDARTGEVTTSGASGADGGLAAAGDRFVWATSLSQSRVSRTNVDSLLVVDAVPLPRDLTIAAVAVGSGSLWVSHAPSPAQVLRYSLPTFRLQRRYAFHFFGAPAAITYGEGAVWAVQSFAAALLRIDARSGETSVIPVGTSPGGLAVGFESVWVVMVSDNTVWRIDPLAMNAASIVKVGDGPFAVATGEGAVWVSINCDATVVRIDPAADEPVATIETRFYPRWLDVGHGYVWVGVGAEPYEFDPPACD
jgi:class 3 adenylate cyclase/streptogramin lyase